MVARRGRSLNRRNFAAFRSLAVFTSMEDAMGLLDVLGGMGGSSRGFGGGGGLFGGGGGMSPVTGAVLGLLAYKAYKNFSATPATPGGTAPASPGGLFGGLGSLLGGGNGGGILSGGLGDLMKQFQQAGHAPTANSWVSTGPNQEIAPQALNHVLTEEQISFLMQRTGLSREDLLAGLSQQLPKAIDQLTPNGRLPTDAEAGAVL
jgi:uncharacterized protein YidB (DUF937 family)